MNENMPEELKKAIENDNVDLNLFLKYRHLTPDTYIHLTCNNCHKEFTHKWVNFKNKFKDYDKINNEDVLCQHCHQVRTLDIQANIPKELIGLGVKENPITFEQYLRYRNDLNKNSSKVIKGTCKICGKEFYTMWHVLLRRQYTSLDEIGPCCLNKYKSNLPEVLKKNSEAQKIAQNRPEVIAKQKIAQAKAMQRDPDLIHKKTSQNNRLRGYFNNIYFASSFELAFLLQVPNAQNCTLKIPYKWKDDIHNYYPDYIYMDDMTKKKVIVELKGSYFDQERIRLKKQAAEQFINAHNNEYCRYELLDKQNFSNILNKQFIYIDNWKKLIKYKKLYLNLNILSISETMLKQSQFKTKQEAIDYINSLS